MAMHDFKAYSRSEPKYSFEARINELYKAEASFDGLQVVCQNAKCIAVSSTNRDIKLDPFHIVDESGYPKANIQFTSKLMQQYQGMVTN